MFTISDILRDIDRGCLANNMQEDKYSYRLIFFVNEDGKGSKFWVDTSYRDLRKTLENIIRGHLSLTNSIVIAETTVLKDGKCICLQSRSYVFSLDGYFNELCGKKEKVNMNNNYGRRRMYG